MTGSPWLAGYVAADGRFYLTGLEQDGNFGTYSQQWFLDGTPVGPRVNELEYFQYQRGPQYDK